MSRFRPSRRAVGWAALVLLLAALAYTLHEWLPPEPRWAVPGEYVVSGIAPDNSMCWTRPRDGEIGAFGFRQGCRGPLVLRDLRTGHVVRTHFDESDRLDDIAHSQDGRLVAVTPQRNGGGRELHIIDAFSGHQRVGEYEASFHPNTLKFAPDGRTVAAGLSLVDASSGDVLAQGDEFSAGWHFTPDSARALTVLHEEDQTLARVFELKERRWSFRLPEVHDIYSLSPDGRYLVGRGSTPDEDEWKGWVVWDLAERSRLPIGTGMAPGSQWRFSADSSVVAVWEWRSRVEGWAPRANKGDRRSGAEVWDLRVKKRLARIELSRPEVDIELAPDGRQYVVVEAAAPDAGHADSRITAYDTATGRKLWERYSPPRQWGEPDSWYPAEAAWFTPDGGRAVLALPGRLEAVDPANGDVVATVALSADELGAMQEVSATPAAARFLMRSEHFEVRQPLPAWDGLLDWLTGKSRPAIRSWTIFTVLDGVQGRELVRVHQPAILREPFIFAPRPAGWLGDDGVLLTSTRASADPDAGWVLECFDVPARKPWRWVLGPPAALGGVVLGIWAWRRRRA